MNLAIVSMFFLATVALQPTLINGRRRERGQTDIGEDARLVLSTRSGGTLVRVPRGSGHKVTEAGKEPDKADKHGKQNGNKNKKIEQTTVDHTPRSKGGKQRQQTKAQQQQQNNSKRTEVRAHKNSAEKEKTTSTCRYAKSAWSECDPKTNMRSRTLTLKKGDLNCQPTRSMQKKCKKTCRYEKGVFSECIKGERKRIDKLITTDGNGPDAICKATREIVKKCQAPNTKASEKPGNKERKNKEKVARRAQQQRA